MIINPSENIAESRGAGRHAWCGLLLAVVPGFGQFYHRQWLKGLSSGSAEQFHGRFMTSCKKDCGALHPG